MELLNDGTVQALVLGTGGLLVWAIGLYVASRAPWRRSTVLAAMAMLCLAVYLVGEALGALASDALTWATWLRRTWWAPSLAAPAWLALTLTLAHDEPPDPTRAGEDRPLQPSSRAAADAAATDDRPLQPSSRAAADAAATDDRPLQPSSRAAAGRVARLVAGSNVVRGVTAVGFALGAAFGALGVFTTQIQDWSAPFLVQAPGAGVRHVPPGPLFAPFQAFVLICLLGGSATLVALWASSPPGSPLRARWAWLCVSAVLFVIGGAWLVVASGNYLVVGLPGQVLLIASMLIVGWNMARYGALLAGEQVLSDFLAYAATMLGVIGLYGAILLTLAPDYGWFERGMPLLLLVMTTHVVVDTRGHLLDGLLYAPMLRTLRGQLRELGNRVVRQPDELTALADVRERVDEILRERAADAAAGVNLRVLVEGALRHLNDLPGLSDRALLDELSVAPGTPLERAAALRSELEQAIERLRPSGARPTPGSGAIGGWLHYLVLREAYVDGRPNKQIMQRYVLSEGTFHRARRRAIDALSVDLAQRAARQSPSTSSGATRSVV